VKYRRALIWLPLLAATPAVHAETLYVIETLVVSVNSTADATGTRIANIKSGDPVEVIERQNDQVHVRLANGTEGWVRKSYLSTEEPLQKRLAERTAEVDKLKQDVAKLEAQVASARVSAVQKASPAPQAVEPTPDTASPADPSGHEPPYFMTPPDAPVHPVWHWALGSFGVALVLGFVLGWTMLDRRIRAKFGGLRIY